MVKVPMGTFCMRGYVEMKISGVAVGCGISLMLLTACASTGGSSDQGRVPLRPLSCIAVLPAEAAFDKDVQWSAEQRRSLAEGAAFATEVTSRQLDGNPKVRLVTPSQAAKISSELSHGVFGTVSAVGRQVGCDGVLTTTVRRFKQREGTEYAIEDPASAEFTMTLVHAGSGAVLWTGDYQETQESFLDNILAIEKVQSRGLKWVSVEQLMEQGLSERLAACPYLQ